MNNLQIFKNEEFGEVRTVVKTKNNDYIGFFYFLEMGNMVKIGCSKNPYQRLMTLKRNAEKYGNSSIGRFAISTGHTNYADNEKILHRHFSKYRKTGTELFTISLDDAIKEIPIEIIYKDETEKIENESKAFLNRMKNFMNGGNL